MKTVKKIYLKNGRSGPYLQYEMIQEEIDPKKKQKEKENDKFQRMFLSQKVLK